MIVWMIGWYSSTSSVNLGDLKIAWWTNRILEFLFLFLFLFLGWSSSRKHKHLYHYAVPKAERSYCVYYALFAAERENGALWFQNAEGICSLSMAVWNYSWHLISSANSSCGVDFKLREEYICLWMPLEVISKLKTDFFSPPSVYLLSLIHIWRCRRRG